MHVEARIRASVPLPARQVFAAWERLDAYPMWVRDLRRVVRIDDETHQWRLHGPAGPMRWTAEVTVREAPARFAYCVSGEGVTGYRKATLVENEGRTEMRVEDELFVGGRHGRRILSWWGDPQRRLRGDVAHLMARLRMQAATAPQPVGFRWASAAGV